MSDVISDGVLWQGSKGGMDEGGRQGSAQPTPQLTPRPSAETGSGSGVKQWQGHPPPGGGGAGNGRPPANASVRKISPQINKTPESNRTRKSPTPELSRVRKSPVPESSRTRKSPTPENTRMRKSPSPAPSAKGSPRKTNKSLSPKGSPQKLRSKTSSESDKLKKTITKQKTSDSSELDGSHYARPTMIEGEDEADEHLRNFNRSVSEPHGGSEASRDLTGMFFQKLIQKEDEGPVVYQSNSSLTSQDSSKSGQSRGSSSPKPSQRLRPNKSNPSNPGTPSPNLSSKYGSGEAMFSINKHQKVDLASFDQDQNSSAPR